MSTALKLRNLLRSGIHRIGQLEIHTDLYGYSYGVCHCDDAHLATEPAFGGARRVVEEKIGRAMRGDDLRLERRKRGELPGDGAHRDGAKDDRKGPPPKLPSEKRLPSVLTCVNAAMMGPLPGPNRRSSRGTRSISPTSSRTRSLVIASSA